MYYYTINEKGIDEIKGFLSTAHKPQHFDEDMLNAWASAAEFQLGEGNGASIEISSFYSKSGRTETFTVSAAGIDAHAIEE
jgi:hypothetical protein